MSATTEKKIIFFIGATGAQGRATVKALLADSEDGTPSPYAIRALTRDPGHQRAKELEAQGVELVKGDFQDIPTVRKSLKGAYGMFVNTDFFTVGDEGETYGGIRLFELAKFAGVRHFIWNGLDYASKKAGWKEEYASDIWDGPGRVGDYLLSQTNDIKDPKSTLYTILTGSPYMDMMNVLFAPLNVRKDGTVVFAAPAGTGRSPLLAIKDGAFWARKIFDNPETMTGKNIEIASDVVSWPTIVETFTRVTGKPAVYKSLTTDEWFDLFENTELSAATEPARPSGTWRESFGAWFALMRDEIIKRDLDWIKSVHPNTTSLEQWMRETKYDGSYQPLLKLVEDSRMTMHPNFAKCALL